MKYAKILRRTLLAIVIVSIILVLLFMNFHVVERENTREVIPPLEISIEQNKKIDKFLEALEEKEKKLDLNPEEFNKKSLF
jgi:type II secretory pathway component PulJ